MKEIKITQSEDRQTVSAKELYHHLGLDKSQWSRWAKLNITNNQFATVNVDYTIFDMMSKIPSAGRPSLDYALTIEFAKKLCMLTRTDKGEQIRDYFIAVEKEWKEQKVNSFDPASLSKIDILKMAIESEEQRLKLEKQKKAVEDDLMYERIKTAQLEPKAQLVDRTMNTSTLMDVGQVAKILGLPFGRNTLFRKLREMGIFFKNKNEPMQEYCSRKYFVIKQKPFVKNGKDEIYNKVYVTQRGILYLSDKFRPNKGVVAL